MSLYDIIDSFVFMGIRPLNTWVLYAIELRDVNPVKTSRSALN